MIRAITSTLFLLFVTSIVFAQAPVKDTAKPRSHSDTVKKLLPAAVVLGKKPVIQMEIDRLRFNVAGTDLVSGNNLWDVIEKTPLVKVSEDGTIQISGTSGAVVYINNKRKMLPAMR